MKLKVTPIRFKDVRGKELLYLEIENIKGNKVLINVGKATLEGVEKLVKEETLQQELPMGNVNNPK